MSFISIQPVTDPTAAQIDAAIALCLRAYAKDVALQVMTGGDESLHEPLFRWMICAGVLEGTVCFARIDNAGREDEPSLVGISVWFGPGRTFNSSEAQKKAGFYNLYMRLSPVMKEWWAKNYAIRLDNFLNEVLAPNGKVDSWYANIIAVDPSHQGRGVATMLIDVIFKLARETGEKLALCAATELNARIYERIGFTRMGQMVVSSPSGDLQFPIICLSRDTVST